MSAMPDHRSDERRMLADAVAGFTQDGDGIRRARALKSGETGLDRQAWARMADMGWLGILVPESAGGLGLGVGELAIVAEGLGGDCAPEPLAATAFVQALIAGCDHAKHSGDLLAASATGDQLIAMAWQETGTTTTPDGVRARIDNGYLSGTRCLVQPAEADVFVVSALGEHGLALYRIARDTPGLDLAIHTQADGSHVSTLGLDGVAVGDADCLATGARADAALTRGLCVARVAASAELLGLAGRLFEMTHAYLGSRKQFGQPLAGFQTLRHRAVDLFIQHELMRNALRQAVRAFDGEAELADLQRAASRAKARCADAALTIGRQAVQMHGAIGYTEEANVGVYLRRVLCLSAWLGNAATHRREYARLQRSAA